MSVRAFSRALPARTPGRRRPAGAADILLGASLWGTAGPVFTLAPAGASSVSVASARIIVGGLVLFALALRGAGLRRLAAGGRRTLAMVIVGAACAAVYQVSYLASVASTGVAVSTVVALGSAPAFTGLLAWTGPSRRWLLTTAGAVLGCALLVGGGDAAGVEPLGVGLALLSGLTYAAHATVAGKMIRGGEDNLAVMGTMFGGAGLLLVPSLLLAGSPAWLATGPGALVTLYLGAVTTGVAYVLFSRGLRVTTAPTATTLSLAEPAVAALLGLAVLGERLGGVASGGLALLTASLVILVLPERRSPGRGAGKR